MLDSAEQGFPYLCVLGAGPGPAPPGPAAHALEHSVSKCWGMAAWRTELQMQENELYCCQIFVGISAQADNPLFRAAREELSVVE